MDKTCCFTGHRPAKLPSYHIVIKVIKKAAFFYCPFAVSAAARSSHIWPRTCFCQGMITANTVISAHFSAFWFRPFLRSAPVG